MYLGGICFITDRKFCNLSIEEMVSKAIDAGIRWIQYRDKEETRKNIYYNALKLREITREKGAILIINDHVDIACAVDSDGVHLGQDDLPLSEARKIIDDRIIGISTHSIEQAIEAQKGGADYIGFGPVFYTETKDAGLPKGVDELYKIKKFIKIPVVAIGGINLTNVKRVLETGVDGIAVASAILKGSIDDNVKSFLNIINNYRGF